MARKSQSDEERAQVLEEKGTGPLSTEESRAVLMKLPAEP